MIQKHLHCVLKSCSDQLSLATGTNSACEKYTMSYKNLTKFVLQSTWFSFGMLCYHKYGAIKPAFPAEWARLFRKPGRKLHHLQCC